MFIMEEITEKKARVRKLLEDLELDGIYLKQTGNFAWITGGGCNIVPLASPMGVVGILITANKDFAVCNNIEVARMEKEEQLNAQGYEIKSFPWYEDAERALVASLSGGAFGADHTFPGATDISAKIDPLRYPLTPWETERYKEQGRLVALAAEETLRDTRPGETEYAVVGRLSQKLWAQGMDFVVAFCAADERISLYRHPIATNRQIEKRAMLCACCRRNGLIVSITRFVQFGSVPEDLKTIYHDNVYVDCSMMAATTPGRPAVEGFLAGIKAYEEKGYPDEYKLHHQGGAIGYKARDYKVTFQTEEIVQENQGFTWNPSITGAKCEDLMIATSSGPVMLSEPQIFPVLTMQKNGYTFRRADILEA